MNSLKSSVLSIVTVLLMAVSAYAESLPASKAAWAYDKLIALGTAHSTPPGGAAGDTDWVDILTAKIKTPNGKELAMGVSLQCGLVTDTTVRSKGGAQDISAARGRIRVRVKITQPDGSVVYGQPDSGADLSGALALPGTGSPEGLTYCDRFQQLEASFAGLNCTAVDGVVTCATEEELRLILKTLAAHHFNFIHENAVPGVHTVTVQARAQANTALGGTSLGAATAEAFTGAGALSVETIRLIKNADTTPDLQ